MRKLLLATSALAGLQLFGFGAQAAEPIQVSLGGTFEFYSGWNDSDIVGLPSHEFRVDPEVHINTRATTDNGLTYGIHYELETGGGRGMRTDEAVGYISGAFGKVEFGDEDGASERLAVYAPAVGFGQLDGDYDVFVGNAPSNLGASSVETSFFITPDSGDSTKVSYFTPVWNGLQAGVSYAAQVNEGDSVVTAATGYDSVIEAGVNYQREFSGVGFKVGATLTDLNATTAAANLGDVTAWQVGGQISYAGATLGGGYVDHGGIGIGVAPAAGTYVGAVNKLEDSWNIGLSYETGPFSVAAQYATVSTNVSGADFESYGIGVAYTVAPGLVVAGDVIAYDYDAVDLTGAAGVQEDDGYVVLVGTILSF